MNVMGVHQWMAFGKECGRRERKEEKDVQSGILVRKAGRQGSVHIAAGRRER